MLSSIHPNMLKESFHNDTALPVELIEMILQYAVAPALGMTKETHLERQKTGLILTLTCKTIQKIVEPYLYNRVILLRDSHLRRFEYTISTSHGAELVSKHTKALWVLCNSVAHRSELIFETCTSLKHLVLRLSAIQMLQFIPRHLAPVRLRELTLIDPVGRPHLQFIDAPRLHIVSSVVNIHTMLGKFPTAVLARISSLCIEATTGSWDGRFFFTVGLGNLLGESSTRVWLKIHPSVKRDWSPDDIVSEEWWRTEVLRRVELNDLGRLKVTIQEEDGISPDGVEKALRVIDYNALHWDDFD